LLYLDKYSESLKPCEFKSKKYIKNATGKKVKERVVLFAKYFTELYSLIDFLDDYSICIRHYNQIIATDTLLKKLREGDNSISSSFKESQQKKPKLILDNNTTQSLAQELEEIKE